MRKIVGGGYLFDRRRRNPVEKVLPRCLACRRYVHTRAHKAVLAALAACGPDVALWRCSAWCGRSDARP